VTGLSTSREEWFDLAAVDDVVGASSRWLFQHILKYADDLVLRP